MKLTENQRRVLSALARHDHERHGSLSGPELSHCAPNVAGRREWALPILKALVKKGFAKPMGVSPTGAKCFAVTPEGVAACINPNPKEGS